MTSPCANEIWCFAGSPANAASLAFHHFRFVCLFVCFLFLFFFFFCLFFFNSWLYDDDDDDDDYYYYDDDDDYDDEEEEEEGEEEGKICKSLQRGR